jgi:hypothetical protein
VGAPFDAAANVHPRAPRLEQPGCGLDPSNLTGQRERMSQVFVERLFGDFTFPRLMTTVQKMIGAHTAIRT